MKVDSLVEDKLGWIDDFRAKPGECGSPLSRKIYLQSLIQQGASVRQLRLMGFSRSMVDEINTRLANEAYGPKVNDLVKTKDDSVGVVTWINLEYPANAGVLVDGKAKIYDFRMLEVISESR